MLKTGWEWHVTPPSNAPGSIPERPSSTFPPTFDRGPLSGPLGIQPRLIYIRAQAIKQAHTHPIDNTHTPFRAAISILEGAPCTHTRRSLFLFSLWRLKWATVATQALISAVHEWNVCMCPIGSSLLTVTSQLCDSWQHLEVRIRTAKTYWSTTAAGTTFHWMESSHCFFVALNRKCSSRFVQWPPRG